MSLVRGQRKVLPLSLIRSRDRLEGLQCKCRNRLDEVTSTHTVVVRPGSVTDKGCDLSHGLDADDTLDGKVGLVRKRAREVVRAQLQFGNERVFDQELRPLVEQVELKGRSMFNYASCLLKQTWDRLLTYVLSSERSPVFCA